MSARSRRTPLPSYGAEAALHLLVFFCPLALGSAPAWTLWPVAALSGLALLLAVVGLWGQREALWMPPLSVLLLIGLAASLLQLVPLPASVLHALSPAAAELREFVLAPLGLGGASPLSLDPAGTWREVSKGCAYLCALGAAALVGESREARGRLLRGVALSGGLVALIGFGHAILGLKTLFGVYAYSRAQPPLLSTFGDPNHLAAYLLFTATVTLGLALRAGGWQRAWPWATTYVLSGAAVFLTLSRGGILFFLLGQGFFGLFYLWMLQRESRESEERQGRWRWLEKGLPVVLAAVAASAVGGLIAYEKLLAELGTANTYETLSRSKIELWPAFAKAADAFNRLGMGRGAFETAYTRYQPPGLNVTFTHPENLLLQLWAEYGLLVTLLLCAAAVWGFFKLLERRKISPVELGVMSGLAALVLHNLFDFNLEYPACAIAACVAAGAISRPSRSREPNARRRIPKSAILGGAVALGALALVALIPGASQVADERSRLLARLADGASGAELEEEAKTALRKHPADYYLYSIVANGYATQSPSDPPKALAFVNRTLFLQPNDSHAHLIAARALLRLGKRSQAFLEYRLAATAIASYGWPDVVLEEAIPYGRTVAEWLELTPRRLDLVTDVATRLAALGRPQDAEAFLREADSFFSGAKERSSLLLQQMELRRRAKDLDGAMALLAQAEKLYPENPYLLLSRAKLVIARGDREAAANLLESMGTRFPGEVDFHFSLASLWMENGEPRRARETVVRLRPFLRTSLQRSEAFRLEGETFRREVRWSNALQAYQSAARLRPESAALQYALGEVYEALNRFGDAKAAVYQGSKRDSPEGAAARRPWIAQLERKEQQSDLSRRDSRRLADEVRVLELDGGL